MFALFHNQTGLELIRRAIAHTDSGLPMIELAADRFTLAKRRWRGKAADGREFGFDLEWPLRHGDIFFQTDTRGYLITQAAEPVLLIALIEPAQAAHAAWQVGNMHFPMVVREDCLMVEDDPILRQVLERECVAFTATRAIFQPLGGAAGHRH